MTVFSRAYCVRGRYMVQPLPVDSPLIGRDCVMTRFVGRESGGVLSMRRHPNLVIETEYGNRHVRAPALVAALFELLNNFVTEGIQVVGLAAGY